jgi:hypothetical protein
MVPLFDARSESKRSFLLRALVEHTNVGEIVGWDPGRRMLVQGPKVTDKVDLVINGKIRLTAKDNQATFSQHGSPIQRQTERIEGVVCSTIRFSPLE